LGGRVSRAVLGGRVTGGERGGEKRVKSHRNLPNKCFLKKQDQPSGTATLLLKRKMENCSSELGIRWLQKRNKKG